MTRWRIKETLGGVQGWYVRGGAFTTHANRASTYPSRKETERTIRLFGWKLSARPDPNIITAFAEREERVAK